MPPLARGVAAALLLPVCAIYLWFPGDADQTLFELSAARLAEGAVYYRDIWDIKQPGIYWVYQAGLALGLGVVGPRVLELGGALLGAWAVWRLSAAWVADVVARTLVPVLVIGSYLLFTHHGGVVVVEGLTVPLLVGVTWLVWPEAATGGPARPPWRWLTAGLLAGLIGVLKTIYLPLPAVLLLGALMASKGGFAGRARRASLAVVGAAVPLGAAAAYFAVHGAWRLFTVTTLVIPLQTAGQPVMGQNRHHFLEMGIAQACLMLPLAIVALVTARRRGTVTREATLTVALLVALALAWPQFPTPYRLLVLVAPLGLLATVGLGVVLTWARRRPAIGPVGALVVLAVLALPSMRGPQRLLFAARDVPTWGLGVAARDARDEVLIGESANADVAPVRASIRPGESVYVLGHPQPYRLLGAREAIEVVGWGSVLQPARVWRERERELLRSRPQWLFVEADLRTTVKQLAPQLDTLIDTSYRPAAAAPRGTWYRTDSPGQPSGIPGDNRLADS